MYKAVGSEYFRSQEVATSVSLDAESKRKGGEIQGVQYSRTELIFLGTVWASNVTFIYRPVPECGDSRPSEDLQGVQVLPQQKVGH